MGTANGVGNEAAKTCPTVRRPTSSRRISVLSSPGPELLPTAGSAWGRTATDAAATAAVRASRPTTGGEGGRISRGGARDSRRSDVVASVCGCGCDCRDGCGDIAGVPVAARGGTAARRRAVVGEEGVWGMPWRAVAAAPSGARSEGISTRRGGVGASGDARREGEVPREAAAAAAAAAEVVVDADTGGSGPYSSRCARRNTTSLGTGPLGTASLPPATLTPAVPLRESRTEAIGAGAITGAWPAPTAADGGEKWPAAAESGERACAEQRTRAAGKADNRWITRRVSEEQNDKANSQGSGNLGE